MRITWKLRFLAFVWFGLAGYLAGLFGLMLPNFFITGPISFLQPILFIGSLLGACMGFCFSSQLLQIPEDVSYKYGRVALMGLLGGFLAFLIVFAIVLLITITAGNGNWVQYSVGHFFKRVFFILSAGLAVGGWSASLMGALSAVLFYLIVEKSEQDQ